MKKKQPTKSLHWVRLDNAAKIYPAARRRNWSNVFRQSITLTDEVDTAVLKSALSRTVARFPAIAARLRRGVFWYYLQQMDTAPELCPEHSYPLVYMSNEEMRKCAFRVIAYKKRIAVEFFHSLTDGTGAMMFLKSLVAEYLEQKYSIEIPNECGVLSRTDAPTDDELEDSFLKHSGTIAAKRDISSAFRATGDSPIGGFHYLTCFKISSDDMLNLAHKHNVTLTVFIAAAMMKALLNLQNETRPSYKRKPVRILIPVNLRKIFKSNTLRNFAMYTVPEADPRLGEYSFDELCNIIKCRMGLEVNAKFMSTMIATNVNDERNPLVRLVPLPVKNLVMKAVFNRVGERTSSMSLSNLGRVEFPEIMQKYISRVDFILGVQATAPYNCGVISYGDTVYINIIRNICSAGLEQHFFKVLQEMGLSVTAESNQ